jgi:hypothetical protein
MDERTWTGFVEFGQRPVAGSYTIILSVSIKSGVHKLLSKNSLLKAKSVELVAKSLQS